MINIALIAGTVMVHYEFLRQLSAYLPKVPIQHRLRIIIGVLGALCAHIIEIWLFAFAYYFMINSGELGTLNGNFNSSLLDCSYYSFTTYTSLGFGDIEPKGNIRFVTGMEALIGLLMITWTASFLYIEMTRYWRNESDA